MISEREGPTTSPQTNLLISLCQQAMATQSAPDQLLTVLASREQGLDQAKGDFVSKVREQGDQHAKIFQKEVDDVTSAFDGYREALGIIRQYLSTRNATLLLEAVNILVAVTPKLVAALDAYEAKFMVIGPSQYPIVNIWLKIADAVRRGSMQPEALLPMIGGAREFFRKCVAEMEQYPDTDVAEAVILLKEGYQMFLTGMDEFEVWAKDGAFSHIDAGLDLIKASHEQMQRGFDSYRDVKVTGGPTRSPMANAVINAAKGVKSGRITEELFRTAIKTLEDFFNNVKTEFDGLASVGSTSATINETIPRALESFKLHEAATTELKLYLEDKNPNHLDDGIAKLTEAANMIAQVEDAFKAISATEGKLICMRCGTPNEETQRVCSKCNAQLPRPERTQEPVSTFAMAEPGMPSLPNEELIMTENLKRLIEETNAMSKGTMSSEDYLATLDWMEGLLKYAEDGTRESQQIVLEAYPPEEQEHAKSVKELVDDTKNLFLTAIEDFRNGLNELRAFVEDEDQKHLSNGLKIVWGAAKVVFQVKKIGEQARKQAAQEEEAPVSRPAALNEEDEIEFQRTE